MITLVFSILLLGVWNVHGELNCEVPCTCKGSKISNGKVENYCNEKKYEMIDRCCVFNNTIIGLDLRDCDLHSLNVSQVIFHKVEIMDLTENVEAQVTPKMLLGLLDLEFLYMPFNVSCPGGQMAWNETTSDNITSCCFQRNPCVYLNVTCGEPDNARCQHLGPGSAKCVCMPGHYGYKCMNDGVFPTTVFSFSVIIPAVVLSVVLWFVQGRDPYKLSR